MKFVTIKNFDLSCIEAASEIALANYNEERERIPELPEMFDIPDLGMFAENNLGVAAFDGESMVGFLCCYSPWDGAFDSNAKGTFSPIHAHGAIRENRPKIIKRLYQAAAEKWVANGITYHAIGLYAHDTDALSALFTYGFGLRCMDAIRAVETFPYQTSDNIEFREISKADEVIIREMRYELSKHLGKSPCFMYSSDEDYNNWLARAETRDTRSFVAFDSNTPVAFIEIADDGENFATDYSKMKNICGAYCLPSLRGSGVIQGLLNYILQTLENEGYTQLGVDFESFNPTAYAFWLKHFKAYTKSVVRRIDECALSAPASVLSDK